MSSQGFPPPDPRGPPAPSTFWQRFGLLDVLLFVGALGVSVVAFAAFPSLPPKALMLPALALLVVRDRVAPSKPRVPRHGGSPLGVVLGLLLFGSVMVLAVSGLMLFKYFSEEERDWALEEQTRIQRQVTEARISDRAMGTRFGSAPPTPAQLARREEEIRRSAETDLASEREAWRVERRSGLETGLQVFGVGVLLLAIATAVQRWRTVPAGEVSGAR